MIYIQVLATHIPLAILLGRHAPAGVIAGLWLAMMYWEAYDMHPDHALFYSVLFGAALLRRIQGDLLMATLLPRKKARR